jgi:hypothetical protein
MNKEMTLRCIMAIIYRDGHWCNQAEKIDEINLLINKELNIGRQFDPDQQSWS